LQLMLVSKHVLCYKSQGEFSEDFKLPLLE